MTYGIKLIRFQDRDCYILLQNENGPCPLLAASNGLILQGIISLPMSSISNNFATLDDVTNILADHAVQKHLSLSTSTVSATTTLPTTTATATTMKTSEFDSINTSTCTDPESTTVTAKLIQSSADIGVIQSESDTTHNDISNQPQQQQKQNLGTNELLNNSHSNENDNSTINIENENDNNTMFYINELMTYIPKFQYGMDFNPKFIDGIYGYEYTAEMTAFDMLHCKIVHGWLINPFIEEELYTIIGRKSYNELVDILISYNDNRTTIENNLISLISQIDTLKQLQQHDLQQQQSPHTEDDNNDIEEKIQILQTEYDAISTKLKDMTIIENFLQVTSHQLTSYGLESLQQEIQCNDICVFFRNNHYSTIYKNPSTQLLYLLVSDMGYADSPHIIWEKLDVINGDTEYCNDQFVPNKQNTNSITNANTNNTATGNGLIEDDYQLAVRLSMEDQEQYNRHHPSQNIVYQQQQQQQNQQQSWLSMIPTTTTSNGNNAVGTPSFSSIAAGMTNVINDFATKIGATSTTAPSGSATATATVPAKALPTTGTTGTAQTNSAENTTIHTFCVPMQQQQKQQATIVTIPHSKAPAIKAAVVVQQQQQLQSQQSVTGAIDAELTGIGSKTPKQDEIPTISANPSSTVPTYSPSNSANEAADRMLALQLQEQDDHHHPQRHNGSSDIDTRNMYEQESLRLALQLQEEDRMGALHYQQQQQRLQTTHIPNQQSTPTRNSNRTYQTSAMAPSVAGQQQQQAVLQTPPQEQQQQQQTPRRRLLSTFQQQQHRVGSSGGGNNTNSSTTPSTPPIHSTASAAGNAKDANCTLM